MGVPRGGGVAVDPAEQFAGVAPQINDSMLGGGDSLAVFGAAQAAAAKGDDVVLQFGKFADGLGFQVGEKIFAVGPGCTGSSRFRK